jgi:hypothetical protein
MTDSVRRVSAYDTKIVMAFRAILLIISNLN